MTRGLYFAFIFLLAGATYAQQSCSQLLNRAEDLYTEGKLLEIPALIRNCLDNSENYTEGEKIRAHKLLTKVYIFTDNEEASEKELVELLHVDPVHEIQPEDPSEIRVLMSKFRTWPIFRIELRGGVNTNIESVSEHFSGFSSDGDEKTYGDSFEMGFQAGADITRYLKNGIEVGAGIQYRKTSYNVFSRPAAFSFETNITNSQTMIRLPIFGRYNLNYDRRTGSVPYVFLGASLDYLLKAEYSSANRSGGTSFSLESSDSDLKSQVNDLNYSLFAGLGLKIRMAKGNFAFVEARFDKSLKLYNIPEERYSNAAVNGDLLYVEDDVFLDFVSLNIGYIRSIFKPEKLIK